MGVVSVLLKIFGIYDLLLAILGTAGNVLVLIVAYRLRKTTTFVFIACLAVTDSLTLYFWNLNHFLVSFFSIDLENDSLVGCKLGNFVQFASLESSAWLLVLLSSDRLVSIVVKQWRLVYFKTKRALLTALATISLIWALNINVLITFGDTVLLNDTYVEACFSIDNPALAWMNIWSIVHSALYSYAPFTLLVLVNLGLLFVIKKNKKFHKSPSAITTVSGNEKKKPKSSVNTLVITITCLFILFTLPGTISAIYFGDLLGTDWGQVVIVACDSLEFSYHGLSILVLYVTNIKFKSELKFLIARVAGAEVEDSTVCQTANTIAL